MVETATFGSEFTVAKIGTEQVMGLRYKLRCFGAPLDGPTWVFGDNESVIKNSTIPQSVLKKRHSALVYHRDCEACAAGVIYFIHIPGIINVADVLTKFLPWSTLKELVRSILFWKGETDLSVLKKEETPQEPRGVTGTQVNHTGRSGGAGQGVSPPEWLYPKEWVDTPTSGYGEGKGINGGPNAR